MKRSISHNRKKRTYICIVNICSTYVYMYIVHCVMFNFISQYTPLTPTPPHLHCTTCTRTPTHTLSLCEGCLWNVYVVYTYMHYNTYTDDILSPFTSSSHYKAVSYLNSYRAASGGRTHTIYITVHVHTHCGNDFSMFSLPSRTRKLLRLQRTITGDQVKMKDITVMYIYTHAP